jgi:hypothetical protein
MFIKHELNIVRSVVEVCDCQIVIAERQQKLENEPDFGKLVVAIAKKRNLSELEIFAPLESSSVFSKMA